MRWGPDSSTVPTVRGLEEMALRQDRGNSDYILEKNASLLQWSGNGTGYPEGWWSHHPWRCPRGIWIWCWVLWVRGYSDGAMLMLELDNLSMVSFNLSDCLIL